MLIIWSWICGVVSITRAFSDSKNLFTFSYHLPLSNGVNTTTCPSKDLILGPNIGWVGINSTPSGINSSIARDGSSFTEVTSINNEPSFKCGATSIIILGVTSMGTAKITISAPDAASMLLEV